MPDTSVRVSDVYPYRKTSVNPEFLLLRRAPDTEYAGQWRMVGGKIKADEAAWETGLREVKEETGQTPTRFWALPSLNAFGWWPARKAAQRLNWPEQKRLLRLADRVLRDGIPASLKIDH